MANSFNRNLKAGDKVVMKNGETVIIDNDETFGTKSYTIGTAIDIQRIGSDQVIRTSGYDIDAEKTMKRHAKKNGWI